MRDCHGIRSLIRCLLELHIDDPQLVRLAAAAVLTREKGLGWSTEEMESVRQELKQLEGAWRRFLSGPAAEKSVERLAALHLAFREMEEAVLKSVPIPSLEELILRVARIQLGGSFSCLEDVEAAVLWPRGGGLSAIAEDALSTCLSSSKEECVVTDVSTHPVEQELMFVRFDRHIPGRMTVVPIPVSISGLWGCPGYRKGGHVEVALPTVNCEVVGEKIPPPLVVDVSQLQLEQPFGKITLRDMLPLLPPDGTVRFSRDYSMDEEVITCYDPKALGEVPLPHDWQDPNFNHRGGRYHLTYTGFWPKQTTRS